MRDGMYWKEERNSNYFELFLRCLVRQEMAMLGTLVQDIDMQD